MDEFPQSIESSNEYYCIPVQDQVDPISLPNFEPPADWYSARQMMNSEEKTWYIIWQIDENSESETCAKIVFKRESE